MLTIRQLTAQRRPTGCGTRGHGSYVRRPQEPAFHLLIGGTLLFACGLTALWLYLAFSVERADVVAVMVLPGGVIAFAVGVVAWFRRPRIRAELEAAGAEWPAIDRALLSAWQADRALAPQLAELGYRTSTARRAIMATFHERHPELRIQEVRRSRRVRAAMALLPVDDTIPERPLHDGGNPPSREQLMPELRSPALRIAGGGVAVLGMVVTVMAAWNDWPLHLGAAPGCLLLGGLCGLPLLASGFIEARANHAISLEVDRALAEWPAIVSMLGEAAQSRLNLTETLQQRGYRSYEVRRAILRCLQRIR